ncbi:MAG: hypothetical protein R6U85_09025 [Salinivirgaceae bacterium]
MKHKRNIGIIALIAFVLSLLGFILDMNELDPSRLQNLIDITLMTVIFFGAGMLMYGLIILTMRIIPKLNV